jgi:uncharacterized membrane protein (UPF0136 family)
MKLVICASVGLAIVVLCGGWLGYSASGGLVSLFSSVCVAAILLAFANLSRRAVIYEYSATALNFLVAIYFAYRMIATERFIPSGILLVVSFLFLFLMLLGIFLDLSRAR